MLTISAGSKRLMNEADENGVSVSALTWKRWIHDLLGLAVFGLVLFQKIRCGFEHTSDKNGIQM